MTKTIFIVSDINQNELITLFTENNYTTNTFKHSVDILSALKSQICDLIIIDTNIGEVSTCALTLEIRNNFSIPIIIISENLDKDFIVSAFDSGCDDFIEKPCKTREIYLKSEKTLSRVRFSAKNESNITISHKDLELNLNSHTAKLREKDIAFTPKEFNLLVLLLNHKNLVFSREQIIQSVWKYDSNCDQRQVDHLIKRLRKKTREYDSEFTISTVRGLGYKILN